jgi:hypothetical protein
MSIPGRVHPDVRMRGFAARTTVEAALGWIDAQTHALEAEVAALDDLHGRVLAEDIHAPMDVPSFDRAAMDGYALRGAARTPSSLPSSQPNATATWRSHLLSRRENTWECARRMCAKGRSFSPAAIACAPRTWVCSPRSAGTARASCGVRACGSS